MKTILRKRDLVRKLGVADAAPAHSRVGHAFIGGNVMDHFLPLAEVERATSLKKSKLYEMVKAGEFPPQKAITARRRAWLSSEVQTWISQRAGVS